LTKRYGPTLALDRLSLEVPAGAVFGLLGPNGSGKTTFLRLVMGFTFPDAGQIERGDDPTRLSGLRPARIGYLSEHAFYPTRFAVGDYLGTLGRLSGLHGKVLRREVDRLLGQLGLDEIAGRRLGALSRGMLQRLGLAQALLGDPPLILLDEPVLGLDPAGQKFMRDQIVDLHLAGKTVFLCSHHLDEVTRVCTHVAILKQGHLMRAAPLPEMLGSHSQVTIHTGPLPVDLAPRLATLSPGIVVAEDDLTAGQGSLGAGGQVTLIEEALACKEQVLRLLLDAGVDIRQLDSLGSQHAALEEIYLKVTGPTQ
jgi:ABC-2 type transport system ATP-binding protein